MYHHGMQNITHSEYLYYLTLGELPSSKILFAVWRETDLNILQIKQ